MKKLLATIAAVLAVLACVVVVRTARFVPRANRIDAAPAIAVDGPRAVESLAGAVRFATVSDGTPIEERAAPFLGLHAYLERRYPLAHAALRREVVGGYSLLYTWEGADPGLAPLVLMGHLDVVPVDGHTASAWSHPPFSGAVADGYVWGRGSVDDKVNVVGLLEAVETLLESGWSPTRTVYLAFGHDEDVGGAEGGLHGAKAIADLLSRRGIKPGLLVDEGGGIEPFPNVSKPVAFVGFAEKGILNVELLVRGVGGHASMPTRPTTVGVLSAALQRLEATPFPAVLGEATRTMLEQLGPEMPYASRLAIANLWLFEPFVLRKLAAAPDSDSLIRTTMAPTVLEASPKETILPERARAVVNVRLLPGTDTDAALERIREVIDDARVEVRQVGSIRADPMPPSDLSSVGYRTLERTIRQTFPETVVVPFLLPGATDSRHYAGRSSEIFFFTPVALDPEELKGVHGTDERLPTEGLVRAVEFYARLVSQAAGAAVTPAR